jgi:hypothetical protein
VLPRIAARASRPTVAEQPNAQPKALPRRLFWCKVTRGYPLRRAVEVAARVPRTVRASRHRSDSQMTAGGGTCLIAASHWSARPNRVRCETIRGNCGGLISNGGYARDTRGLPRWHNNPVAGITSQVIGTHNTQAIPLFCIYSAVQKLLRQFQFFHRYRADRRLLIRHVAKKAKKIYVLT